MSYQYNEKPADATRDAVALEPTPVNTEETGIRLAIQKLNAQLLEFRHLLAQVTQAESDIAANVAAIAAKQDELTFQYSIDETSEVVELLNDEESPGNWKGYATNGSGTKGWLSLTRGMTVLGTSNQFSGMNNAGNDFEYKSLVSTADQVTVTHGAGTMTLSLPQDIGTASIPTFGALRAAYIYPEADAVGAFSVRKADGETGVIAVDTTNSRVGIVQSTPDSTLEVGGTLHVTGAVTFDDSLAVNVATAGAELHVRVSDASGAAPHANDAFLLESATHHYMNFISAANQEAGFIFSDGTRYQGGIVYDHGNAATDLLKFRTAGSTQLTIDSSGNVVMGTVATGVWEGTAIAAAYVGLTFQHSLTEGSGNVNLVNDEASPGNSKLYGTSAGGAKGWQAQPAAGDTHPAGTAYEFFGWNSDASAAVARDIAGTANEVDVSNDGSTCTIGLPTNVTIGGTLTSTGLLTASAKVKTAAIYPASDSTTAVQIEKANASTVVVNVDTTNARMGINNSAPGYDVDVTGTLRATGRIYANSGIVLG